MHSLLIWPVMPAPAAPEPLFTEQQGFLRPWWWALALLAVFIIGTLAVAISAFARLPARHPVSPASMKMVLAVVPLSFLLVVGISAWLRLDTRLDTQGITYRMRPLGWRRLQWSDVVRAHVRKYAPIAEYGGWGIKGRSFKNYAYNVSGNQGLQLELADGRRILLGTQRPAELRQVLAQLALRA